MNINFIERGRADTPSIERVFREIGRGIKSSGHQVLFCQVPYGNGAFDILRNLLAFKAGPADVYHITGHIHYMALRLPPDRTVLTIHDLGILRMRTGARRAVLKKLLFGLPVSRLRYIVAISEATKAELVEVTGCDPAKIRVIGNPVPESYRFSSKASLTNPPRILMIGTAPHKNLERMTAAVEGIDCELRIVGPLSQGQRRLLTEKAVVFTNVTDLDEAAMRQEYIDADIVAFCSLFEGFGMPIIEAQAIGRPVITSRREPMSSVAGDGALIVDPESESEIRDAIERLLASFELRSSLIEAGARNAERFTLDFISREYLDIYNEILDRFGSDGPDAEH